MNETLVSTLIFMGSFSAFGIFVFFGVNFISKGWFFTFLKVKASRGKKIVVELISKTDIYYRVGMFDGEALRYKLRSGKAMTQPSIPDGGLYPVMGVFGVCLDETTGSVLIKPKAKYVDINPQDVDSYMNRILKAPQLDDKKMIIVMALVGLTLVGLFVLGFMVMDAQSQLNQVISILNKGGNL